MNKEFYPTPIKLIRKMIDGIDFYKLNTVLEPSAGKGNIIDYIKNDKLKIDAIEIDEDLRSILKGKKYNVIFDDFLEFQTNKKYDLIIANFPFSDGDLHLQKAIQIQEMYGGSIICLLNAETLKNPYTNLRKSLLEKLQRYNAQIEYLQDEFVNSERSTNVEVAMIKIVIEKDNKSFLLLNSLKEAKETYIEINPEKQVVENDFAKAMIARYNFESQVGIKLIFEYSSILPYLYDRVKLTSTDYQAPLIELKIDGERLDINHKKFINKFLEGLRLKYWSLLLNNENFRKRFTQNLQRELNEKLSVLKDFDFNLFNIQELEKELTVNLTLGIEETIIKLFDELSQQYSYYPECNKNIHYYNGWKTNKVYKINKKVILPINGFSAYSWDKNKLDTYNIYNKITDMVKVFNYLGGELSEINELVINELKLANNQKNSKDIDFYYFKATFYKKGTCHITFQNDELLKKFNIFGSQRKGWLPPSYGKKSYKEMDKEEKSIIDEFEGEQSYKQVMNNKDYYLVQDYKLMLN